MNNKKFSILIPVYNRAKLVKECIDSIFAQTYRDYEIIAIDDGSTDQTWDVLQSYGSRIFSIRQSNQGPEVARHLGASKANGEYLVFLDSDDMLLPWSLAVYNRIIQECSSPALIIGVLYYYREGQYVQPNFDPNSIIELVKYQDYFSKDISVGSSCSNIVIKSSVFREGGGCRQTWPKAFPADQHDTQLRFGTYGPCVILKTPFTVAYRTHDGNVVHEIDRMINIGIRALLRSEHLKQYPGGNRRRLERYAIIGGDAWSWVRRALKANRLSLALKLLIMTCPMLAAGALNKFIRLFRDRTASLKLKLDARDGRYFGSLLIPHHVNYDFLIDFDVLESFFGIANFLYLSSLF